MLSNNTPMAAVSDKKLSKAKKPPYTLTLFAAFFSACALMSGQVSSDDTEIFFADELGAAESTANVLFMFDVSGSMDALDSVNNPRLNRLKEAMISVVESSSNVNIGIGSFGTGPTDNRGSIQLEPVGVDQDMCANATCNSVKIRGEIKQGNDDARILSNGTISLDNEKIDFQSDSRIIALRFDDLNIPRGAIINSANLELISSGDHSGNTSISIAAEAVDNSAPITGVTNSMTPRIASNMLTNSRSVWNAGDWTGQYMAVQQYASGNLNSVVSEVTNRPGWCGGNALTLFLQSTGNTKNAFSFDDDPYNSAVLQIDYDPSTVDWSNTCMRTKLINNVALGIDDVIEGVTSGVVEADGGKLRTHRGDEAQIIGLRFADVQIPANAAITSAYISMNLDGSVDGDVDLAIQVEDTSFSAVLDSSNANELTGRSFMGGQVAWNDLPTEGSVAKSPDISALVTNVVSQAGWTDSGAITFALTPTSTGPGQRFFTATDSPSGAGAKLIVHFQRSSAELGNQAPVLITGRDEMIRTMKDYESRGGTPLIDAYYETTQYMRGAARQSWNSSVTGNYTKPEFGECKTNQIVLLSDGEANDITTDDDIRTLIEANPTAGTSSTPTCANRTNDSEECGVELAKWMYETDHDPSTGGTQSVITHTIGFNISTPILTDIAEAGKGSYYQASSATELTSVFKNIIQSAITLDTGFIAPSSAISLNNRLVSSNELYFALFKPSVKTVWDGNLKRFELAANSISGEVEIRDSLGMKATNPDGSIKDESKSFWSADTDGNEVARGGAASNLQLTRKLYTSMSDDSSSNIILKPFHESNAQIDTEALGILGQNAAYRTELLKWARGVDVKDYDGDSNVTEVRAQMGDPMHSTQHIMHYPGDSEPRSLLFVGTNHGFLHAINTSNGHEEFAYIPEELLPNLDYFYRDEPTKHDERPYGLDGEVTGWHEDTNENGLVDGTEKAYIYVGMRRGGRNYYALDVSDPDNPAFLWKIEGGKGDYVELAQTWSRLVKTKVNYGSVPRDVLFFAGGYDEINDDETERLEDSKGRALFMVDAVTREFLRVWDSSDFSEMLYSIPSDLRIINPDGDAFADAIFVGDTGGQLWRFDINNSATSPGAFLTGTVMADIGGSSPEQNRQFFYEPDVSLLKGDEGGMFLNISIGSGSRPSPNSTEVQNGFYSFRDRNIFGPPRDAANNVAYPAALVPSDLVDATDSLGSSDTSDKREKGWFFNFSEAGEKSLSAALTVNNELMFTTYTPAEPSDDICTATIGGGKIYTLNAFNGDPAGNKLLLGDRYTELEQDGIPPRVAGLIVEASPNTVTTLVGMETIGSSGGGEPFERTFWAEQ